MEATQEAVMVQGRGTAIARTCSDWMKRLQRVNWLQTNWLQWRQVAVQVGILV